MIQLMVPWSTSTRRPLQISETAITPPSSDYTDAYLAAFAPKPIRVRHLQRLTTPAFVPVPRISRQLTSRTIPMSRPWSWGHFTYVPSYSVEWRPLPKILSSRNYTRTLLSPPKNDQKPDRPETLPLLSQSINSTTDHLSNKYEKIINEISEALAAVSPLSSTLSSLSPGKTALDFELSEENSPNLVHPPPPPRPARNHLIRGDSYDKIVHVMADLDSELPPTLLEEDPDLSVSDRNPSSPNQLDQPVNEENSSSSPLSSDTSSMASSQEYILPLPLAASPDVEPDDDRRVPRRSTSSFDQSSSFSDSLEPHSSHPEQVTSSDDPPSVGTDPVCVRPTLPPAIPLIVSPVESLPNSVVRRYISSDVYHGYLGGEEVSENQLRRKVAMLLDCRMFRSGIHRDLSAHHRTQSRMIEFFSPVRKLSLTLQVCCYLRTNWHPSIR